MLAYMKYCDRVRKNGNHNPPRLKGLWQFLQHNGAMIVIFLTDSLFSLKGRMYCVQHALKILFADIY